MSDLVIVAVIASFTINFGMAMSHYASYRKERSLEDESDMRRMRSDLAPRLSDLTEHVKNLDKAITDILKTNPDILDRLPKNNIFRMVLQMNERKS